MAQLSAQLDDEGIEPRSLLKKSKDNTGKQNMKRNIIVCFCCLFVAVAIMAVVLLVLGRQDSIAGNKG